MAKGLFGGMTDYNHQTFKDILIDIEDERKRTISFKNEIQKNIDIVTANSYWGKKVPVDFRNIIAYALKHYETAIVEFEEIKKELKNEVKEHHIKQLSKIATVAREINFDIGKIWHQQYDDKEYGDKDFLIVERIYGDTRDMAVNLIDVSNMANRLKDFIGKTKNMQKNNPWISGSFYLALAIVVITGLAVLSRTVHWTLFPIIIIAGILIIVLIGILQLKNDDKITDKSFVSLVTETFKRLPLIGKNK
jgi:hypothetical protein